MQAGAGTIAPAAPVSQVVGSRSFSRRGKIRRDHAGCRGGSRFNDKNYKKPFAPLADRAVWLHSAEKFLHRQDVVQLILVISPEDREYFDFKFSANVAILGIDVVGGKERSDSVENALARLSPEADHVAIHDAARPCLADDWITEVFEAAEQGGAAILAIPVASTLKRVADGSKIVETVSRDGLWGPRRHGPLPRILLEAYGRRAGFQATDDAQLVERLGKPVTVVRGSPVNMKISTKEDIRLAEQALPLPKPKLSGPAHPFAGDDMWRYPGCTRATARSACLTRSAARPFPPSPRSIGARSRPCRR